MTTSDRCNDRAAVFGDLMASYYCDGFAGHSGIHGWTTYDASGRQVSVLWEDAPALNGGSTPEAVSTAADNAQSEGSS